MKILTIGYNGWTLPTLVEYARTHNALVIDVRAEAWSARVDWRKESLVYALGLLYMHVPDFGNTLHRVGGMELRNPARGLTRIVPRLARQTEIILLCGCRDAAACHRTVVADWLAAQIHGDVPITHLEAPRKPRPPGTLPALTIQQPWCAAIMAGVKQIENRTWSTDYRGELAIHASARTPSSSYAAASRFCAARGYLVPLPHEVTMGAILGTVQIVDIVKESDDPWFIGTYGWVLERPQSLRVPVPARGTLGLWYWRVADGTEDDSDAGADDVSGDGQ